MYHIDYFCYRFRESHLTVIGILSGVFTVMNALLITGTIICVYYCWKRRKKSIKHSKDIEQSPQDTHLAPLTSGNTLRDNISYYGVCNINSSPNNV